MIAVLIALILALTSATTEASVSTVTSEASVVQTAQEQALEASAWESLDMVGTIDIITEETIVDYSHTVTVEDGTYSISATQFAVVDPYDSVYVHIFNVEALAHA